MNLQESIRKDLNILSEAPDYEPLGFEIPKQEPQVPKKIPTLIVDKSDFVDYCAEHISDTIQLQGNDLALDIYDQIMANGNWGLEVELDDLVSHIRELPAKLVKNKSQIKKEFPELWKEIESTGMIPDPQTMKIDMR